MRAVGLGTLVAALAACAIAPSGPLDAADVPVPPDPACVADEYAYFGETTMAALGVSRPSGRPPPDANRLGTIWITADRRFNEGERREWLRDACSASSLATTVARLAL